MDLGPVLPAPPPQRTTQPTRDLGHPGSPRTAAPVERGSWVDPQSPGGSWAGASHRHMHPCSVHTHIQPPAFLPQPSPHRPPGTEGDLRHSPVGLKNKRKSYTSIFHSLKKCFKKLCTGGGGWEPCSGAGREQKGSSPPACSRVPTLVLTPLLSPCFLKQTISTRTHTCSPHALQAQETSPSRECPSLSTSLTGPASGDPQGTTRLGGERGTSAHRWAALGRPWDFSSLLWACFLSCQVGSPSWPRLPKPPDAGTDEGGQEGAFGDVEALGRGPENPRPSESQGAARGAGLRNAPPGAQAPQASSSPRRAWRVGGAS
jgi:hypothetical protein